MKRAMRIIVPLLLSICILLSIGWYLFEYDPDFTRDMLLQQARRLEQNGNHDAAVWFYDLAYRQAADNDLVAIELAEKFKELGNYSKAEKTLSNAIADGGTAELYIALCQTYVEQDKLLDAVEILDKIKDPVILQQMEQMRPQTPVASSEPGFYSTCLSISLESESGTVYYSTDEDYPSCKTDAYQSPIALGKGDTVIYALTIGENGLVSKLGVFSYTIGGVIEEVSFADSAFEAAARQALDIEGDRKIYSNELWGLEAFTVPGSALTLQDLNWMPYLKQLTISGNVIDSLAPLNQMNLLESVVITDSVIPASDLSILASRSQLTDLTLSGCSLTSIEVLASAQALKTLDLSNNSIRDIRALQALTGLEELDLSHNAVVSLLDLSGLLGLRHLNVAYNSLVTTEHVSSLTNLTHLDVSGNELMKLSGVDKLTKLQSFCAAENALVDINELAPCKELEKLDISGNTLLNIDIIADFVKLRELNFSGNEVSSLPDFADGCQLVTINGAYNQLKNLTALSGLQNLENVFMDWNEELSSIWGLNDCPNLKVVNIYGTPIRNVSFLTDKGITVTYTPL